MKAEDNMSNSAVCVKNTNHAICAANTNSGRMGVGIAHGHENTKEDAAYRAHPRLQTLLLGIVAIATTFALPLPAQVNSRNLSDFLGAQGTTRCFTPPVPAQLGWGPGADKTNGNANLAPGRHFALIDYTGLEAAYLKDASHNAIDLGTTVTGTVRERPLADGRALVMVDLHTHNALGWATQEPFIDFNTDPLVIGSRVQDLLADRSRIPALGESHFMINFIIPAPGAPLPDLVGLNYDPVFCPNVARYSWGDVDFMSIEASITGPLHVPGWPEGATGRLDVKQTGVRPGAPKGGTGPLSDGFPVESITVTRLGH